MSNAEGAKPPVFLTCSNLAKTVNNQTPLLAFSSVSAVGPCAYCGYVFDQEQLGHYGCPNCCGEGLAGVIPFDTTQITSAANYSNPKTGDPCHPLAAGAHPPAIAFNSNAQPDEMKFDEHVSAPLTCSQYSAVAIGFDILETPASEAARATEVHTPLRARVPGQLENSTVTMVASGMRVRRLTPVECEKLQGFEPGYTAIPKAKDGPRYKALGNSMAVPVMRWIGRSIDYALLW